MPNGAIGAIIFCRTFKNYFGQIVWIEKKKKKSHYNCRVSLHEAPTKTIAGLNLGSLISDKKILGIKNV